MHGLSVGLGFTRSSGCVLWSWGWAAIAGDEVENLTDAFNNAMLLSQAARFSERDPGAFSNCQRTPPAPECTGLTLIFSIAALDLLVHAILDVFFQTSCSGRLVETGDLQDVGSIDPVV